MRKLDPEKFVHFALLRNYVNQASQSFVVDYLDNDGNRVVQADPKRGGAPMRVTFNRLQRKFIIPKAQVNTIEKIRNHPQCMGSPNGTYAVDDAGEEVHVNAVFTEINEDKDATHSISATKMMNNALNKAFEVFEDEVLTEDLAIVLGIKGKGSVARDKVLMYAQNNPKHFLEVSGSHELRARALATKAFDLDLLHRNSVGEYSFGELAFGYDKEDVVSALLKGKDKFNIIERAVERKLNPSENLAKPSEKDDSKDKPKRGRPSNKS